MSVYEWRNKTVISKVNEMRYGNIYYALTRIKMLTGTYQKVTLSHSECSIFKDWSCSLQNGNFAIN